jgi:hypothetical protein
MRYRRARSDPCPLVPLKSALSLNNKQAIVLVLLLSLGLWAMIWVLLLAIRAALGMPILS